VSSASCGSSRVAWRWRSGNGSGIRSGSNGTRDLRLVRLLAEVDHLLDRRPGLRLVDQAQRLEKRLPLERILRSEQQADGALVEVDLAAEVAELVREPTAQVVDVAEPLVKLLRVSNPASCQVEPRASSPSSGAGCSDRGPLAALRPSISSTSTVSPERAAASSPRASFSGSGGSTVSSAGSFAASDRVRDRRLCLGIAFHRSEGGRCQAPSCCPVCCPSRGSVTLPENGKPPGAGAFPVGPPGFEPGTNGL
jgi:hypothetical protein